MEKGWSFQSVFGRNIPLGYNNPDFFESTVHSGKFSALECLYLFGSPAGAYTAWERGSSL
jgi:hypothetical protein